MAQNKTPKYKNVFVKPDEQREFTHSVVARKGRMKSNVLLIRFSAIGDVAMTVPVIHSLATAYPSVRFTMLTNVKFAPFFEHLPANVEFLGVNLKQDYHGFGAMLRLYRMLRKRRFDAVADLHGVLRTSVLSFYFRLAFRKVCRIDKDRRSRKRLTRLKNKDLTPRLTSFDRYKAVLNGLGFNFDINFNSIFGSGKGDLSKISFIGEKDCPWIGIAPFAAHKGKIYPLYLMEDVIAQLDSAGICRQFVFAYGREVVQIEEWTKKYRSVELVDNRLGIQGELILMSHLNVMLAMDSSNMHMASLTNTPVVSVWGATHPVAGFKGFGQKDEDCVQLDLPCRPCSIYGKKECIYSDYRCLTGIDPDTVFAKVKKYL